MKIGMHLLALLTLIQRNTVFYSVLIEDRYVNQDLSDKSEKFTRMLATLRRRFVMSIT